MRPKVDYMRISVTDLCNLRCVYCMPPGGIRRKPHDEILRYEEIERLVRIASGIGITRVRITGGEPLVRRGVVGLVERVGAVGGIEEVSLTTNGILLPVHAEGLRKAGVRRINISLDSLREDRYRAITRVGALRAALAGVESALACGFEEVKINVVVMSGVNDDEVEDFLSFSGERSIIPRFIEFMPVSSRLLGGGGGFLPIEEVRLQISRRHTLARSGDVAGAGPAVYYTLDGGPAVVGLIAPVTRGFCRSCNRLRLTADGRLRPCLMSDDEIDVKGPLRSGAADGEIAAIFGRAIAGKSFTCDFEKASGTGRKMIEIGG